MLRRLLSLALLVWLLGFILFATTLPQPAGGGARSDAVIVLTGGEGRIARGIEALRAHWAPRMLVAGVDPEVQPAEFAARYHVEPQLMACCVTLGSQSVDTRSNATEARDWMRLNHMRSVRLVTSDWHMRRAAWEMRQVLRPGVTIIEDPVVSHPKLDTLFLEYCKLVAQRVAAGVAELRKL